MPERRDNGPFAKHTLPDDEYQHIIFEQQRQEAQCDHSMEFWVAVQTRQKGLPVVIQWCMRCQASEVLTWEEYQIRKARNAEPEHDDQEDWLDILR